MTLANGDATWRGYTMGASLDLAALWSPTDGLLGLGGPPRSPKDNPPPDRLHDPCVPGWATIGWRQITANNMAVQGADEMDALAATMVDHDTIDEFVFHDERRSSADLAIAAVADRCEYPLDALTHSQAEYRPSLQWLAADPTILSATATTQTIGTGTPVGHGDLTVTNAGNFASPSGRQWTLTITARGGPATGPYVRIGAHGEEVSWPALTLTDGQTLTIDAQRRSWVGALRVDGLIADDFPDWPILQPGAQTMRIGVDTGTIEAELQSRSTWS